MHSATTRATWKVYAEVTGPDGKTRNLGRIDSKRWAPRAWLYRYVTFPRLARAARSKEH